MLPDLNILRLPPNDSSQCEEEGLYFCQILEKRKHCIIFGTDFSAKVGKTNTFKDGLDFTGREGRKRYSWVNYTTCDIEYTEYSCGELNIQFCVSGDKKVGWGNKAKLEGKIKKFIF